MGKLAIHLAAGLSAITKRGWQAEREAQLLSKRDAARFGYRPQVDLMLHGPGGKKVAVELEISRADPVANEVKFLLAHRAGALDPDDALVSMFSSHIKRGRRNMCGAFVRCLRADGVPAFQLCLLPHLAPGEIQRLNHLTPGKLERVDIPFKAELDRVLAVVQPRADGEHRIHFAGDVTDVIANLWEWNDAMAVGSAAVDAWGRRHIQFFVFDPHSKLFAPSKFCAFVPAARWGGERGSPTMTLPVYTSLGENDPRFDGYRARKHLVQKLAFDVVPATDPRVRDDFARWVERHSAAIGVRGRAKVVLPPPWYASL